MRRGSREREREREGREGEKEESKGVGEMGVEFFQGVSGQFSGGVAATQKSIFILSLFTYTLLFF